MAVNTGMTAYYAQTELVNELKELFKGKKYTGQQGTRKELSIYAQNIPIQTDDDYDADDPEMAFSPYIVVELLSGELSGPKQNQVLDFSILICVYDDGTERAGYQDIQNIREDIIQHFTVYPDYASWYTTLYPIDWAVQRDDTHPYYYAAVRFSVTTPVRTLDGNEDIQGLL